MTDLPDDELLHTKPITFMSAPYSHDLSGAKAAVLGVPFDCGIHPFRIGSRQGPTAIRGQSNLVRRYNPELADFDPVERLGLVDRGDVRLTPSRITDAFARIETAAKRIHDAGVVPVTMGGDGSVSLPLLRAAASRYPGTVAVHLDAHTDSYGYDPNDKYHIGIRGTTYVQGAFEKTRSLGYNIITLRELFARGFADVLAELHERLKSRPVYLCFDMDVFDPSCAPGVATPSWGGLSAREGIEFLRGLSGLDIIAVDVNTVSPPHDVRNMTAFLAAQVIYETLVLLCQKPG
jgi:agmatinase